MSKTLYLLTVAALLVLGCGHNSRYRRHVPFIATVFVTNQGLGTLTVYSRGFRLATVAPNKSECVKLYRANKGFRLYAKFIGEGHLYESPPFDLMSSRGWQWTLGTTPRFDRLSLVPSDPCEI